MNLTLITHIIIALSGIALTTYAFFRPSVAHLRAAYVAIGLTFATGFYLVAMAPAHMVEACTSGLMYLGVVSIGIVAARAKLARMQMVSVDVHTELN
jgi:hypothetical protein